MNVNVLFLILSIALIPCETGRVKGRCGVSSKLPDSRARGSNQMDSDNSFTAIEESNSTINKINAKKSEATEYEISTPKSTISSKTTDPLEG